METEEKLILQEKETGRVEAFSDGVFAIAITLLVLDLKVPKLDSVSIDDGLFISLFKHWPAYLAFTTSFLTILIMWVNHHNIFNYIQSVDGNFLFINGFLLLTVTVIPFPTSLLAEHMRGQWAGQASAIYAGIFFLNCFFFTLLWFYSSKDGHLLDKDIKPSIVSAIKRNGFFGLFFYLFAVVISFFSATVGVGICLILAIFYALTGSMRQGNVR